MTIKFEEIIPTDNQIDELYGLLKSRKFSISHKNVPSKIEHHDFICDHPYVVWYLLYKNSSLIGSVYIQFDNSIGLNLIEYYEEDVLTVINYIKNYHDPLPSIKSIRRGEFFLNIASENTSLIAIMKNLKKSEIQRSFII